MKSALTIALAGNPNAGKSTMFNNLTGAHQHVGNYPGVTVEKKEGRLVHDGVTMNIVDLPGTYSLTTYSLEERVARDFVLTGEIDVVVDVVDASNPERNLYLATQLMEMDLPLVLAFNMDDVAKARGFEFDLKRLSELLGWPIVRMTGHRNVGTDELLKTIIDLANAPKEKRATPTITYGREIEAELARVAEAIETHAADRVGRLPIRWLAVKLLEGDAEITQRFADVSAVRDVVATGNSKLESIFGERVEFIIAERRYGFISGVCQECVKSTVEMRHDVSDRIDAVVTHPLLAMPIFLITMYLVFQLTFTLSAPFMGWIETGVEWLGIAVSSLWTEDNLLKSLLVDGIISGVGGVLVFLPNIVFLFLAIAFLEDTGYMARAAFIMDRLMHKMGLHGKSFIPMLIGFGCSVPAILATRMLEDRRDRLTTMMIIPLMSCGARLPIYMLIIPAFFTNRVLIDFGIVSIQLHALILWAMYLVGIMLAILLAKLLKLTVFKGEAAPFVMELPPYRLPTLKAMAIHTTERGWMYVKKAGTVILAISVILWALTTFPRNNDSSLANLPAEHSQQVQMENSFAGQIGHALEPALKPMGFDWRIGTALIGAFAAKEVFVAQMGIVFSVGEIGEEATPLREHLQKNYSPLIGVCIMLFCLVSMPCVATIAATRSESGSMGWAIAQLTGLTIIAYILTVIVYQSGHALGLG